MSSPITIQDLTLGNANSVEDPKILANFAAIKAWIQTPGLQAADLASNSVTTAKIADSTGSSDGVTTAKLATGAVTNAKLASDAVKTDNIGANEVSSSKIRLFTVPKYVTSLPTSWSGTVNFTSGSTSVTVASTTSGSITVGTKLSLTSGSGIPSDAIVTAYSAPTITLNRAATATSTGVAATTAPQTGDEVYYEADSTNSIIWHLRYRASADGGNASYPWEFVGGRPLRKTTASVTGNSNWQLTSGVSPSVPLGGDYDLDLSLGIYVDRTTTTAANVGVATILSWPTKITSAINSSVTSATINNASAVPFSGSQQSIAAISTGAGQEIVTVSNRSTSTVTIARGTNGTSAASHSANAPFFAVPNLYSTNVEQAGIAALSYITGSATPSQIWAGGSRSYRFTGLEASATQIPEVFHRMTSTADSYRLTNVSVAFTPVRVG